MTNQTNQTNETRAKAGGQYGVNGEFYEGGQFLPTSENTVKGAQKPTIKAGKTAMIAPYKFGKSPADDMLSIYARIQHYVTDNRRTCEYIKGEGFQGLQVTPVSVMFDGLGGKMPQKWYDFIADLAEKFNAGDRWFPLVDDPFHYKNQG